MLETLEKPEILESRVCSVCGSLEFQVLKRNRNRTTETLECAHSSLSWHLQAERLQLEIAATVSPSLKRLLTADFEQVLTTHKNENL